MSILKDRTQDEIQQILADAWLNLGYIDESKLYNPIADIPDEFEKSPQNYIAWVMSRPEYFSFLCKYILNVNIYPMQAVILETMWNHKFPMLVCSRGLGKSYLLALYSLLRLILLPGRKIAITGAAFRQSKIIFEYMENIYNNAPLLKDMIGFTNKNGPKHEQDMWRFFINDSVASAYPLGTGEKIRGQRANDILVDEMSSINREILETVIFGFSVVAASPVEKIQAAARKKLANKLGIIDRLSTENDEVGNQIIISGTASYQFNHFYDYFKKWRDFIGCKGDTNKIAHYFQDGNVDPAFNWKDYCVLRIPYILIPEGHMDAGIIARAKATIHSGTYNMEYGACLAPNTKIIIPNGICNIQDINVGDLVLTHTGRFMPVIKKLYRNYNGVVNNYKTLGYNNNIVVTTDHPFWYKNNNFYNLLDNTNLTNLKSLNCKNEINIENYISDYLISFNNELVYSKSSQSILTKEQIVEICNSNDIQLNIAKKYNTTQANISRIKNIKKIPKGSIKKYIKLDYNFGLIIGYYAAEGSVSKSYRQTDFALDEHSNTNFHEQLINAIKCVFNLDAKKYTKQKNTVAICINNRLIGQLIKHICPGHSYTKYILPEILYSNKDFLLGFIEGYCNGDGHISKHHVCIGSCSKNLLSQTRIALSYFGISCSFNENKKINTLLIGGNNYNKFMNIFYKQNFVYDKNKSKIINNNCSEFPIIQKKIEYYDGVVYNLEVEGDNSYSILNATVHNCFSKDSSGFFKRSVIESCVVSESNPITDIFSHMLIGNNKKKYIFGIDPASEVDNFSISVLEINENHKRVVYGWSTNKTDHRNKLRAKAIAEQDFYAYCIRKIRDLMKKFPCVRIVVDSQGGGVAIREGLKNTKNIEPGELPIYESIDYDKPKDTDGMQGLHILEMVNFASADWTSNANHGLRFDLENKTLIFPCFDSITLGIASVEDMSSGKTFDTLEDCVFEIEELKNELSNIIITKTNNGRDKWDTPDKLISAQKKSKMRKDRYCALLMANYSANTMRNNQVLVRDIVYGGFADKVDFKVDSNAPMFNGPDWFVKRIEGVY